MLDHSVYSYQELRSAYLERIHKLHPDKHKSQQLTKTTESNDRDDTRHNPDDDRTTKSHTSLFLELQEAWKRYDDFAKMMKRANKGNSSNGADANFTLFGVGCSFADNEAERELRNKIMDQASRGWFSAGELGTNKRQSEDDKGATDDAHSEFTRLSSDDSFEELSAKNFDGSTLRRREGKVDKPRPSLISHLLPPKRR